MLGYRWEKTTKLIQTLGEIEVLKKVYDAVPGMPKIQERLLRRSLLKSAVYSARIEGIPATINEPRMEAQNLVRAYTSIFGVENSEELTVSTIKRLHGQVLNNLSAMAGQFRAEPWAIYTQAGMAIHIAPPHWKLPELMEEYIKYINGLYDSPIEVAAAAQFMLEKIHPFADGNGRVGRLASAYIMAKTGYGFKGLLTLEEYIEEHRERYYEALTPATDMTEFMEYIAEAVKFSAQRGLQRVNEETDEGVQMLPRREEIWRIIKDHPKCSFDFIQRRFVSVNPKTLHYDVGWLIKHGYVKKLGVSRGVVYEERS